MIPLGLCLAALSGRPLPAALAVAAGLDLRTIDLPVDRRLGLVDPTMTADDDGLDRLRGLLRGAGVTVAAVSESSDCRMLLGPYGGYADAGFPGTVEDARRQAMATARRVVDLAAALGAAHARLFLGCPDLTRWLTWHSTPVSWADNVTEFADRVEPLLRHADDRGVRLLIEPHPKQVAYDLDSLRALLAACDGRIGVCLDPANLLALGHDPVQVIRGLPGPPAAVQAKDVQRAPGGPPPGGPGWVRYGPQPAVRFRVAGRGEVDWPELLTALIDVGYDGPVLIEHEDVLAGPDRGIAAAAAHLGPLAMAMSAGVERSW